MSSALTNVDVMHLHNAHGHYIGLDTLSLLTRRAPLVWTFHDFYPITGGCAFPFDCEKWRARCGCCPQLGQYPISTDFDRTRRLQGIKKQLFRHLPVTIVCPSQHLARAVRDSGMFELPDIRMIPYGVDTDLFTNNRRGVRQRLALPQNGPILLLSAQGLDDPRKGMDYAVRALHHLHIPGLIVLLVGRGDSKPIVDAVPHLDIRSMGYVESQEKMAELYAAANLFMFTSLAENFPCSVQESMACGTAVLSFAIDGVVEQIVPDETGFLVPTGDADKLASVASELLQQSERLEAVGHAAQRHAVKHWSMEQFLGRHETLYREVAARKPVASM